MKICREFNRYSYNIRPLGSNKEKTMRYKDHTKGNTKHRRLAIKTTVS